MFSQFGEVKNVKINENSTTGFVCFSDREAARQARDNTNGTIINNKQMSVSFCEPKEQRKIHLEEAYDKRAYEQRQVEKNMKNASSGSVETLVRAMGLLFQLQSQGGIGGGHHYQNGNSMNYHQPIRSHSYNRP